MQKAKTGIDIMLQFLGSETVGKINKRGLKIDKMIHQTCLGKEIDKKVQLLG